MKGERAMRRLMWFTVGFTAACGLCAYWPEFPLLAAVLTAAGVGLFFALGWRWFRTLRLLSLVLFAFAAGSCWFWQYDVRMLSNARAADGTAVLQTLEASDYSYKTDYGSAVDAKVTIDGRSYAVRAYLKDKQEVSPGDRLEGVFRLRFTASGGSRESAYHPAEGIFLLAYQQGSVTHVPADKIPTRYFPAVWREKIKSAVEGSFPEDARGFAKALLLGDRTDIDYSTNTAFRVSGISHIIAVSGLHVSMLLAVLFAVFGRNRYISCYVGIPLMAVFAAIAGFTPSIVRACIMQSLILIAALTNREYDPPTAIAFAVLVMLIVNPLAVTSVSLQLSVSSVIGITAFYQRIHDWFLDKKRLGSAKGKGPVPRLKRWFVGTMSVSLSACVMTTPLVACYFGTVSLVAPLTNLVVLWAVSLIFGGILLAVGVSLVSLPAAGVVGAATAMLIRFVVGAAKLLSKVPLSAAYMVSKYMVFWLIGAYVMLAIFLCMKKKPVVLLACCISVTFCAATAASWIEPRLDRLRVTVLDVGQGQSVLLQSGGKTFLVDCGGDSSTKSADIAAETLLSQGIGRLDGVIVTHYDADHTGGLRNLLTRIDTDLLLMPKLEDAQGVGQTLAALAGEGAFWVEEDQILTLGDASLTVYAPEMYKGGNECGLCVLFRSGSANALITGDRGDLGELFLVRRGDLPEVDLLVAGHHGSAGSTGERLLNTVKPRYVFISVGEDNPYGHPAPALLERLALWRCTVCRTDQSGTLIYRE